MLFFLAGLFLFWANLFALVSMLFKRRGAGASLTERFLLSFLAMGLLVVIVTEGLSLFSLLTARAVQLSWAAAFLLILIANAMLARRDREALATLIDEIRGAGRALRESPAAVKWMLGLLALQAAALLITIAVYPTPNNVDSMDYHLARTLHWTQQQNVAHFATHDLRQLTFPPFSEFTMLNTMMLAHSDHFTKVVQWAAMLATLVGIAEIAKRLGGFAKQQAIAALLAAAIPMGILQATSTQNDYVLSAWLACFFVFGLGLAEKSGEPWRVAATGAALGLAVLTKGTAYVFAFPLAAWLGYRIVRAHGFSSKAWKTGLVITAVAFTLNLGHFGRNVGLFGTPLGESHEEINEIFGARALASNALRNLQIHMLPEGANYPDLYNNVVGAVTGFSARLHTLTRLKPNDPRTTFNGDYAGFERPNGLNRDEGLAGSFAHFLLIAISIPIGLLTKDRRLKELTITFVIAFLLFSLLLKSHTHISRLQLPLFILWMPVVGLTLFKNKLRYGVWLSLFIWALGLPWLLNNAGRPLIPPDSNHIISQLAASGDLYFLRAPELLPISEEIADAIIENGCQEVGTAFKIFEYSFWRKLQEKGFEGTLRHVLVENESRQLEDTGRLPCAVLASKELGELSGYRLLEIGDVRLYLQQQ